LRQCIAAAPFYAGERIGTLEVTASVGLAALEFADDTPELILQRAAQLASRASASESLKTKSVG